MVSTSSFPQPGSQGNITLNGYPLLVVPGTYQVEDAKRFGDKLSLGNLKYADFNPYENAHVVSTLRGGYGLRRYSDVDDEEEYITWYLESDGVDCSNGTIILSPLWYGETLPTSSGTIVWLGEFTPSTGTFAGVTKLVCVGFDGTSKGVWYRNTDGSWTLSAIALAAQPVRGAVGVFGGALTIGFGPANAGIYTTDLATSASIVDEAGASLCVCAYTADNSTNYIAGGTDISATSAMQHYVTSSLSGGTGYSLQPVICGGADSFITSLAPGGGSGQLFVGKDKELGMIGSDGIYRSLVPFDSRLSTNCRGMRWWLGRPGEEQRGPALMIFPRDRSLWAYQPSSESSGSAQNISPWAQPSLRPLTAKGITYAIQGSARWLYYSVQTASGDVWILRRDAITGASHTWFHMPTASGGQSCQAMAITNIFSSGYPLLFMGQGKSIAVLRLPLDGENPLDDTSATYTPSGTLTMPAASLRFPDEIKNFFSVRMVGDNLIPGGRRVLVEYSIDGGAYASLGYIENSPAAELFFPQGTTGRRVTLRLTLSTTDQTQTPQILGFSIRMSLNPKMYRVWGFSVFLPSGQIPEIGGEMIDQQTFLDAMWSVVRDGTIVSFTDRWNNTRYVRVLHMKEKEVKRLPDHPPETAVDFQLLEVSNAPGRSLYNDALSGYGSEQTHYG